MSILIIEDNKFDQAILKQIIESNFDFKVICAETGEEGLKLVNLPENNIFAVILDLVLPGIDGKIVLESIHNKFPDIPVIIQTGNNNLANVVEIMKLGAYDYLPKPIEPSRVVLSIKNSIKVKLLNEEILRLKKKDSGFIGFEDIIGSSKAITDSINEAKKAASSDIPVLITGESGVGKELFAKAIHNISSRAQNPFIAINCGAIPDHLIESILFGHEKGSFTGAINKEKDKFREAEGGTIFLDEIGELKADMQVKLLRALQQKEIDPVGSGKTVKVDVRVISATNRELLQEVGRGNFRQDLFYRLNVFPLHIPALRERRGDINLLARHFLHKFITSENKFISGISDDAMDLLVKHNWQGNIRELENCIFRAVVICEKSEIRPEDVKFVLEYAESNGSFIEHRKQATVNGINDYIGLFEQNGAIKKLDKLEKEVIKMVLNKLNGNIPIAARELGISQATIYRKLKEE